MPQPLENVREELLRAGLPPRVARRYVMELQEHLDDLTEKGQKQGLSAAAAGERAHQLLGTDDQLTQAMIEASPRAFAVRAPWAVFGVVPLLTLISLIVAIDYSMFRLLGPAHAGWPGGIPNSYSGAIAAASFVTSYLLGPGIAAACIVIALRHRLSSGWVWVGLGLVALVSSLLGFHMSVLPSVGGRPGGTVFSAVPSVWVDGRVSERATYELVALRATVLFALAGLAFGLLRKTAIRQFSRLERRAR